jgi:predicted deacylase
MGFEMIKRENPYDDEDINRNFPGDANGNTTERLTNAVFNSIAETKPDLVIDLHADTQNSLPYVIIDRPISAKAGVKETIEKTWELAEKFGITVTYDIEVEGYKKYKLDQSLTAALLNRNQIPAFLVELGGPRIIDEKFVKTGMRGIKNILLQFGMIDGNEKPWLSETKIKTPEKLELVENITSKESGIAEYLVKPGQFVRKGEPLVKITNIIGKIEEVIFTEKDCYIISLNDFSVSFPGSGLISLAVSSPKTQHEQENLKTPSAPKGR